MLREQDKHFLWSLYVAIGVIFVWKGLWEGAYVIADTYFPYLSNPWVFLFFGLTMLTLSGMIFKEFDPLGNMDKSIKKMLKIVVDDPKRKEFKLKYHDDHLKRDITFNAAEIRTIEKKSLILKQGDKNPKEFFIPGHKIVEIIHNGKTYWRS